jgi:hypothetical protein
MNKTGKNNVSTIKGTRKKNIKLDVNDIPENIQRYLKEMNKMGIIPLNSVNRALSFNKTRSNPIIINDYNQPKTDIKDFTLGEFKKLYNAFKKDNSETRKDNRTIKRKINRLNELDEPDKLDKYLKSVRNSRSSRRNKSITKKSNKAQQNDDDIDADTANILQDLKDEDLMNQSLPSSPAPSKMNTTLSPIPLGIFSSPKKKNKKLKIEPPMNLQGTNLFQGHQIDYDFFDFMNDDDLPKTPK